MRATRGDGGDTKDGGLTGDALKSRGHKGWGVREARGAHGDMEDGGMRGQITGMWDVRHMDMGDLGHGVHRS